MILATRPGATTSASIAERRVADELPPFPVEPEAMAVLHKLWSAGHAAYLVGGGVRDALLGLPPREWDVATDAIPERILTIFPGGTYENQFGTVLARGMEITTFRRDHRYADHRRPERVTFSQDVYEDLARRDLTINAIAWGRRGLDEMPRLLDPADGRGDLEARLVRAVGDPGRRFDEDALRLLRAVRIAAHLDFSIEPITRAAMQAHALDISWVSKERIGREIRAMLSEPVPSRAFRIMDETGLLETTLPELAALRDAALSEAEATTSAAMSRLDHALATLDAVAARVPGGERLRLAALLHVLDGAHHRHILERLRVSGRATDSIGRLIEMLARDYSPSWDDAAVRRYMQATGAELLDDLMLLVEAHVEALGDAAAVARASELRGRIEAQRRASVPLTLADLAIDGAELRDTLGIPEGPTIGIILSELLEDVVDDPSLNERMTLLTRASLILDALTQGRGRRPRRAVRQSSSLDNSGLS